MRVEVRYPAPGQYLVLFGQDDLPGHFAEHQCSSVTEVDNVIRTAVGRIGWENLRVPILASAGPDTLTPIPPDLLDVLRRIEHDRRSKVSRPK
jgi:hypothetical protein